VLGPTKHVKHPDITEEEEVMIMIYDDDDNDADICVVHKATSLA
jgi:hypothetical protein